jgi:hypothetical protein
LTWSQHCCRRRHCRRYAVAENDKLNKKKLKKRS